MGKTYFGIKREVFMNDKCVPEETIISVELYSTKIEALEAIRKIQDHCALHFRYQTTKQIGVSMQEFGGDTYRHEWKVIEFKLAGE